MELVKTWLPDLNKPGMNADDKIHALNDYLISLEKQLRHVLSNIDEENFSETLISAMNSASEKIKTLEGGSNRGESGGNGSVSSVDGVLPDGSGNVPLGAITSVNGKKPDDSGDVTVDSGPQGEPGADGVSFIPSLSEAGELSWTNDGGLTNPDPVNIRGPRGEQGLKGETGANGYTPQRGVDYWTEADKDEIVSELSSLGGNGMQMELLWTNASPDSAFAAQTITVPTLKNYPMYAVETSAGTYFRKALDGYFYMSVCATWLGTDCYVLARNVNVTLSTGKMEFSNAIGRNLLGGGGGQSNTEQVPRAIYGVKGVPS